MTTKAPVYTGPYLTPVEAADILRVSPRTLLKWRGERKRGRHVGPDYVKRERNVLYPMSALTAYLTPQQAA